MRVQFEKGTDVQTISKADAIEAALDHGWIDGRLQRWEAQYWSIRFMPRRAKSRWSQNDRDTVERRIAAGRMTARGQAEVDAAKSDGRRDVAYAPQSKAEVPPDLRAALGASPVADDFRTLKGASRYAVLYRIHDAKKAATRAKRVAAFVAMLVRDENLHGKTG